MSTGSNVKRIHNIIFASPSKSIVRVLQSLGRGLRKAEGKEECVLYDISDNFHNDKQNHTLAHSLVRYTIYAEQGFIFKLSKVHLS